MSDIPPPPWIDLSALYTRQDIAALTGIDEEVLGYWVKRGLLVHSEGGEGKGVHRRYPYAQVNIAVILAVFREHFGANIATLSSLAKAFQRAVKVFSGTRVRAKDWWKVANLGRQLRAFRNGEEVIIEAHHWSDPDFNIIPESNWLLKRPAGSEAEIIARELAEIESHPGAAIKLAECLGPNGASEAAIAKSLLGLLIDPRYYSDTQWLIRQQRGEWIVLEAYDGQFGDNALTEPGTFVPTTNLLRKVWDIPAGGVLHSRDTLKRFNMALRDEGIKASARYADPRERGFVIEPKSASTKASIIGLRLGLGRHADMDRAFASRYENIYWTPADDEPTAEPSS